MRHLRTLSTGLAALLLVGAAWAEIYETKDAEGNPEFTDSPPESGGEVINLQQTNIIDAPTEEPQQVSAPQSEVESQAPEQDNRTVIVHDRNDDEDEVYDDYQRHERAFDRVDPDAPREVLNAEAPREVGDSDTQMPHEVGDFNSQIPDEMGDVNPEIPDEVRDGERPATEDVRGPIERRIVHPHNR